jgi:hypothetical protein
MPAMIKHRRETVSQLSERIIRSALVAILLAVISLGVAYQHGGETAAAAPRSECVLGDPAFDKLVEEIGIGPAREQCKQQEERDAAAKAAAAAEEEAALAPPPKPPEASPVQAQIDEIVARNDYKFVYGGSAFMRNCLQSMVYTSYLGLGSPTLPDGAEAACMKSVEQASLVHARYQPDYDPTFEARQREEALAKQKLLDEIEKQKQQLGVEREEQEKLKNKLAKAKEEEEEAKRRANAKHGTDNKDNNKNGTDNKSGST